MSKIVNGVANDFEFDMFPPNVEKIIITKDNYNRLFKNLQEENMFLRDKINKVIKTITLRNQEMTKLLYIELLEILSFLGLNDEETIVNEFFIKLPTIKEVLIKDLTMYVEKDPASLSIEEVVLLNNSFHAVFIYRIANLLHNLNVCYVPRILSEYAHSITGIDIHPACRIGENFFIDHGTGIVIGETTEIKNNVAIYQGVTLGALSLKKPSSLKGVKRHPTILDNVTIYANATILGGSTVIKENSVIPGNAFITSSN